MMLNRRQLLAGLGTLAAASATGQTVSTPSSPAARFADALQQRPWLSAFRSVSAPEFQSNVAVQGRWPGGLKGTLYRNGPAQHETFGFRYRHWFDGDGMLQAYRVGGDRVLHQARMIETRKYRAETSAGRALYPTFGSAPPNPAPVSSADEVNVANISVLHHHGELLALWEAGSPWAMDPETLATKGIYSFSDDTAGAPFSAHPRVEPDGTLWNFGYLSSAGLLALWHIDRNGKVVKTGTVKAQPMGMPHDFVVTERHIVVLLAPLLYRGFDGDLQNPAFVDAHAWHPEQATRVLVVSKDDFSQQRWFELPAQWVFHFGNAWEANDVIHFDAARADTPEAMLNQFRSYMVGEDAPDVATRHTTYRIDLKRGTAEERDMLPPSLSTEFPSIDPRVSCRRNRRTVLLTRPQDLAAAHPMLTSVSSYDAAADTLDTWHYPATVMPEEHIFVPAPGSAPESEGWVVGTALDFARNQTMINVFDVRALKDGPVASATLPYALPLGLHGRFVA